MANIKELREELKAIRTKLKTISKNEVIEKMGKDEKTSEYLKYAFEYADEGLKSLASVDFALLHLELFLDKEACLPRSEASVTSEANAT